MRCEGCEGCEVGIIIVYTILKFCKSANVLPHYLATGDLI